MNDDEYDRRPSAEELLQAQILRAAELKAKLANIAILVCAVGSFAALFLTGSIVGHLVGYVASLLAATGASIAQRLASAGSGSSAIGRRRLNRLMVFNLIAMSIAVAHAVYLVKRYV